MFGIATDLILGDSVSNIVHEFRHNLNIFFVFRVTRSLDATQDPSKVVLDPFEGTEKE